MCDDKLDICQTCLSTDRFLYPLSDTNHLLNELNFVVQHGSVCWECRRLMEKWSQFKLQVVKAQRLLHTCERIEDLRSLTELKFSKRYYYDTHFDPATNIQITCTEAGPILIKQEMTENTEDHTDGEPLGCEAGTDKTQLYNNHCAKIIETSDPNTDEGSLLRFTSNFSSDLPRITSVESITDNGTETNEASQPITEIIELNIPIPQPIPVEESKAANKSNESEQDSISANDKIIEAQKKISNEKVKDTITVKVVKQENLEGPELRIKDEPVSDAEDSQPDPNESGALHNEQEKSKESELILNSTFKVEPPDDEQKTYQIWKRSILLVYSRLRSHKFASRFLHPITEAIAPNYSLVVKRPMDLNTIRRKIRNGVIKTTAEFQRDVLLMLSNALMYNSTDHCIHDMAKDLMAEAQYQLGVLLAVYANSALPDNTPTRSRRRLDNGLRPTPAKTPKPLVITPKIEKASPKPDRNKILKPKIEKKTTKVAKKRTVKGKKSTKADGVSTSNAAVRMLIDKNAPVLIPKLERLTVAQSPMVNNNTTEKPNVTVKLEPDDVVNVRRSNRKRKAKIDYLNERNLQDVNSNVKKRRRVSTVAPKVKTEQLLIPKLEKKRLKKSKRKLNTDIYIDDMLIGSESEQGHVNDYGVAITTDTFRDLTREEGILLKKTLEEKILNLALDFSKVAPRFRGKPIIADGVIKLWCEDKKSLKWLVKTINKLPQKMGKFLVMKQTDVPRKLKTGLLIPGSKDDVDVILKLLKAQNPWAQVDSWTVYSAEQRGESMFLVLGIPSTVVPVLLSYDRRLAYSLGSVYIKFYSSNGHLCDNPPE